MTRIIDPAGNARTFTYEPAFNRVTSITDALGNVTRFEYDLAGNLTATVDPLGNRTTIAYNGAGQPIQTTDPLSNTTLFAYDAHGNLASVADPLGNVTQREYDAASRLIRQLDTLNRRTMFTYDPLNRITNIADARGEVTRFSYDPNGNLLTVTDARGGVTGHTYDSMDRVATRTDPVGAVESFAYDRLGSLVQHTDRKGQVATFTYDALNRRTQAGYADGATTSFAYDAVGRLIAAADSVGGTIENAYDMLDRLAAQSTALGTVAYRYDALGRRTEMTAPGQAPVTYGYDAASRLTAVTQGAQVVTLAYDAAGRRTLLTLPNSVSTEYQYDAASRITALIYRNATGVLGDLTYGYDAAGNRTRVGGSLARTLLPEPVASATYDAANRQLTFGSQMLSYDANGSLTFDGANTYTWDARNRLTALAGLASASFQYDALGRRTRKTIDAQSAAYLYDGADFVQETTGATAVPYLRGLDIDEPLVRGEAEYYLADALGSVVALVEPTGAIGTLYTYDPFGRTAVSGALTSNAFGFTGRENDETGLYYYRARYYDAVRARFIAEDSLREPDRANLYAYAKNNPLRFVDSLGTAEIEILGHTVNVFGSLTLLFLNIQADLTGLNFNFNVMPSFGVGADFLINVPSDAVLVLVGSGRHGLTVGTGLVITPDGGVRTQGIVFSPGFSFGPSPLNISVPIGGFDPNPLTPPGASGDVLPPTPPADPGLVPPSPPAPGGRK